MNRFGLLLRLDLRLSLRQASDLLTVVVFFLLAVSLFPLAIGPDVKLLARIAPGVLWVGALFAATLSFERLYHADYEDGTLDQMLLCPTPLQSLVLARCLAHWLVTGLPLCVMAALLGLMLDLPRENFPALIIALLLGTPTLSLLGALGAALTLGARRSGALVPVLILPLAVPVLIFGAAAGGATLGDAGFPLTILLALFLATLALVPWAIAASLRNAAE
jgi:heme exporter protein B